MTRLRALLFLLLVSAIAPLRSAETDSQVNARRVALDLAGAFSNDGFKIRDGYWSGPVKQGEQALVAVNLYAGNQYWFSVGADEQVKKVAVQVFDEHGKQMETESFEDDDKAAAGFSPNVSGQYLVAISANEGEAGALCLVYSYK